jgi:hypothetical protein
VRAPSRPGYLLGEDEDETEQDNVGNLGVNVEDDETIEFGVGSPTGDYADEATGE